MATIHAVKELVNAQTLPCNVVFVYEGEEECRSEGFAAALLENSAWFAGAEVRTFYWQVVCTSTHNLGDCHYKHLLDR